MNFERDRRALIGGKGGEKMLYLIKRGPRPDYHKAPFHPVILCTNRKEAMWHAGETNDKAWVWVNDGISCDGWLLCRWEGLDIDFGNVVKSVTLPDGALASFWRLYEDECDLRPTLTGAIWWSKRDIPKWIADYGVKPPEDDFTKRKIEEWRAEDYYYLEPMRRLFQREYPNRNAFPAD